MSIDVLTIFNQLHYSFGGSFRHLSNHQTDDRKQERDVRLGFMPGRKPSPKTRPPLNV